MIFGEDIILKDIIGPDKLIYNRASVYQDRNVQDLIVNLEKEIIGYRNTLNFIVEPYTIIITFHRKHKNS
jgi:hypothetical protein